MRWQAHAGFAAVVEGRCYKLGDVLFIGPPLMEEPGGFKGDFLDSLKCLPAWERTRFYCVNARLSRCSNGQRLTWEEVAALAAVSATDCYSGEKLAIHCEIPQTGNYRLGKHEVIKDEDGSLRWQGLPGSRSIKAGMAFILGDLLFLEPGLQKPFPRGREEFLNRLELLPQWIATNYFVTQTMLRDCQKSIGEKDAPSLHASEIVKGRRIHDSANIAWKMTKSWSRHLSKGLAVLFQWLKRHWDRGGY